MTTADFLIALREWFLDLVSGSDRTRALNAGTVPEGSPVTTSESGSVFENPATEIADLLHEIRLQRFIDDRGNVNYRALQESRLFVDFRNCTEKLRRFDPASLQDRDAKMAFWINLYNTLVLDGVISLGIQRSVMEKRAGFGFFRQAAYIVGGQRLSCDDIEHGILRANRGHPFLPGKQFGPSDMRLKWIVEPFDMRVHFALNCASHSCPPIRVYLPGKIDAQLDLATRSFLASDVGTTSAPDGLHISSIFKWYSGDFGGRAGIFKLILSHLSDETVRSLLAKEPETVSLRYKPYDWSLNSKAGL